MTSIPPAICGMYRKNFKRQHLRNKTLFLDFLMHFWNRHEILEHFQKKDEDPSLIISEIIDAKRGGYLNV